MGFSKTMVGKKELPGGLMIEWGTWNAASVTTGEITADTAGDIPDIKEIMMWGFASDGDNAVKPAKDVAQNKVKITCTSSDTGDYFILGPCA